MPEEPKKKPRRKLLQVAALATGAMVGAGVTATGCASSVTDDVPDASPIDASTDTFVVGRVAQDAVESEPPGLYFTDAGTTVLDAGND